MNAPVATKAAYSDLRLIKGRKVAVICLEIPIEQAESFVAAFGMPNPAEEKWVAIARLNGQAEETKAVEPKERQKFSRLRSSTQAALLCRKPAFWKFLGETFQFGTPGEEELAADIVRSICTVESRSELDRDNAAAQIWIALHNRYDAWVTVGE